MLAVPAHNIHQMDFHQSDIQRHQRAPSDHALSVHEPRFRQFAYPAQIGTVGPPQHESEGLSFADRIRRRKTPNGPVTEIYEGALTDKSVQVPASKHVLLSTSPRANEKALPSFESSSRLTSSGTRYDSMQTAHIPGYHKQEKLHQNYSSEGYSNINYSWDRRPAWEFPGGLDSMLNQNLPLQPSQRYYVQYSSTVPTVHPLPLQSYAGPTASASIERYGPYWPDGSFNPYRPSPVRDDRFFDRQTHARYHESIPKYLRSGLTTQDHLLPSPTVIDLASNSQRPYATNQASHLSGEHYRSQDSISAAYQSPHAKPILGNRLTPTTWASLDDVSVTDLHHGPASKQHIVRETEFTWAQAVYLRLLASIQHDQKVEASQAWPQPRRNSRPGIYPKPPRKAQSSSWETRTPVSRAVSDVQSSRAPKGHSAVDSDPPRPGTAIFSPNRRVSDQINGLLPLDHAANRIQTFADHYNDKHRALRRVSDTTQYQYMTLQSPAPVQTEAAIALERIEALCAAALDEWIDGMLLAGCLAYGLGEYYKAMKWYQTILQRDSGHVEALSNLAATLLALNRREEAMQLWMAAVRLRPSYFEAVEHLIGLLCHSRRTKDAVATIQLVEHSLRLIRQDGISGTSDLFNEPDVETKSRSSSIATMESVEKATFDYESDGTLFSEDNESRNPGFGSSGFAIPGVDNGRILALVHAKGNMLYSLGDNQGAAAAFEDAILIATGGRRDGIKGVIRAVLATCQYDQPHGQQSSRSRSTEEPILLSPERALSTVRKMFPPNGDLPGFEYVARGMPRKAAVSTTSNSLLSLAKIYQDGMSVAGMPTGSKPATGTGDILALYYLSLSLQPSPSTANNVGILLASVQQSIPQRHLVEESANQMSNIPGVVPGSGVALALAYYNYGLNLDQKHAHLYTNLGSLLKDIGQLNAAIKMYELAVQCDGKFDIALANLANAVKDQGRVADAIQYYKRAVQANPDFAEAVCGLATALNSVCGWHGRGGIYADGGRRDHVHVDETGKLEIARRSFGWMNRVVEIVVKQLKEGETWGIGTLNAPLIDQLSRQLGGLVKLDQTASDNERYYTVQRALQSWSGNKWEGSRVVRLIERAIRQLGWRWYQDLYKHRKHYDSSRYTRPCIPAGVVAPNAPTVLPFHTFTAPLSAKQIRQISQRNGLRISVSTLRSSWLPATVYPPPMPPRPCLNVGYVSSDFNNHPLAHLMQSVFGLHNPQKVHAICYATTPSDNSVHRQQIEKEAPVFHDASSWTVEQLVQQIVRDNVHILVNLNGYTRGARNEVFAARPAPIHMSFMGFAGTLGAEWCDYILADEISVPRSTLSPYRHNVTIEDRLHPDSLAEDADDWVYNENIIYTPATFFCCDHKQSAPESQDGPPPFHDPVLREQAWQTEQSRRWQLRRELFPTLSDNAVILANFNQLYKIDPATFRMYLRILSRVPNAILWLLRFPDLGEQNLLSFARNWGGSPDIVNRVIFTDVASKGRHIERSKIVDLVLDTPECNAHTTGADVCWGGTPGLTWARAPYKMCSRMGSSIIGSALPVGEAGDTARADLLVSSEEQFEDHAVQLATGLRYPENSDGRGRGRLMEIRRLLWEGRWSSRLFDTKRWVETVERAYWAAWTKWERGEGGDIWL